MLLTDPGDGRFIDSYFFSLDITLNDTGDFSLEVVGVPNVETLAITKANNVGASFSDIASNPDGIYPIGDEMIINVFLPGGLAIDETSVSFAVETPLDGTSYPLMSDGGVVLPSFQPQFIPAGGGGHFKFIIPEIVMYTLALHLDPAANVPLNTAYFVVSGQFTLSKQCSPSPERRIHCWNDTEL